MNNIESNRVMVSFVVNVEGNNLVERMHAVSEDDGTFVLDNSPFYAFDISFGDRFEAIKEDGVLTFSRIIARGGHSTYRIKLPQNAKHDFFLQHWSSLEELGCSYEGASDDAERKLYSIDIPPGVNVFDVYRVLEKLECKDIWEFEEGHYFRSEKDSE